MCLISTHFLDAQKSASSRVSVFRLMKFIVVNSVYSHSNINLLSIEYKMKGFRVNVQFKNKV